MLVDLGCWGQGLGLGARVQGLGFMAWGLGFRVVDESLGLGL